MRKSLILPIVLLSVGVVGLVVSWSVLGPGRPGRGPWNTVPPGDPQPLTLENAAAEVRTYLASQGYGGLELAEVMEFSNHFYAAVKEEGGGKYAFELLVNRYTGEIFPEPGPNMMWNTRYGHMGGGMMGRHGGNWGRGYSWRNSEEEMSISPGQAREAAQRYLDARMPEAAVGEEADEFYGYYTLHYRENGEVAGMLSVNGYTADVWVHEWHDRFVRMEEYADRHG